jgi:hypothetical protein
MGHGYFLEVSEECNYSDKCNSRSLWDDTKNSSGRRLVPGELGGGPAAAKGFDEKD